MDVALNQEGIVRLLRAGAHQQIEPIEEWLQEPGKVG